MMHFKTEINRPPYETADGFLQITEGCSHGHCLFCSYFQNDFRQLSMEEIEGDVKQIPETYGEPTRIFLQGADAYSASYDILMQTAELIHKYVPSVKTIGGFARVTGFYDKSAEQLRELYQAGYADPYFGIESGRDATLKLMNKGYNSAQAREQLEKLEEAGMPYILNYLCGAAGEGKGIENARDTAKLYAGLHPTMINMTMMTVVPETALWRLEQKGGYVQESEIEKLEETKELLRLLDCETTFMNEHASNFFHIQCKLPDQRDEAIAYVQSVIDNVDEEAMRRYREEAIQAF